MSYPNIFSKEVTDQLIERINHLNKDTKQQWGIMNVSQMLAHCNVAYEMVYENIHPKPNVFVRFLLKLFVKKGVVGDAPYKRNIRTAPAFVVNTEKDFETEKKRLVEYLVKTQSIGAQAFDGKESLSFGELSTAEWNNLFYKHLDHHLTQFGV